MPSDEAARRTQVAAATYETLRRKKRLQSHRLLTYRCRERDMLLDVMSFPTGLVLHVPANTARPDPPVALTQQGRPVSGLWVNNRDVEDRSRSQTWLAEACVEVTVGCSHVGSVVLAVSRIRRDLYVGQAEVILAAEQQP